MPTDGEPADEGPALDAALEAELAALPGEDRADAGSPDRRWLRIGIRLGLERPEQARRLLELIGAWSIAEGPSPGLAPAGSEASGEGSSEAAAPPGVEEAGEAAERIPVASLLLARAAAVPPPERGTLGPEGLFGWATRLTSAEVLSLGRVVDVMLASGSPPDVARGFGITWSAGVRLPHEDLEAMFREFPELEITVGGILAGRDLRALGPAPRPTGFAGFLDPWFRRTRPELSAATSAFERGGRPAQHGLVALWNAWVAMRYRDLIPPSTFELLVHPWVTVVGPLPER